MWLSATIPSVLLMGPFPASESPRHSLGSDCVQCEQCVLEGLCEQCDRGFWATQTQPSWLKLLFPPPKSSSSPWLNERQQDHGC